MYIPDLVRKEGLRRGLSPRTIRTYSKCIDVFFRRCRKRPFEITKVDVKDFLDRMLEKGAAGNTINVYLNALKFLYTEVFNRRLMVRIRYSKVPKKMPVFLTKEEVLALIAAIGNPKHRLMVKLMYSAGLRVGELVRLKPEHFEFSGNYGWVRLGKGAKDRPFIVAESIKNELRDYMVANNISHDGWLFLGNNGNQMSIASVQKIIKKAAKKAGIKKRVHPHALRHSFATHIIQDGNDVVSLQSLLGHKSPETTMVYVHMANPRMLAVKSPLDQI